MRSTEQVAPPTRAIKSISERGHVPQSEVTRLYEDELAGLGAEALSESVIGSLVSSAWRCM